MDTSRLLKAAFLNACLVVGFSGASLGFSADVMAQASSVRSPSAVRLMPAIPTAGDIETVVERSAGGSVPSGFVERRVGFSAGPVNQENANLAATYGGWPRRGCSIYSNPEMGSSACSDGRAPSTIVQEACAGAFESVIYEVVTVTGNCTAAGESNPGGCTTTGVASSFYTCAAPVTYISYLIKDTSSGSVQSFPLTSAQIAQFRFGMGAVLSDAASRNAVCKGNGYKSAFNWTQKQFYSCRDNRVSRYLNGTWVQEAACTGEHIDTMSCSL